MLMISDVEIAKRLEFHEGKRAESYYCSGGFLTQGIGHNLQTNPLTAQQKAKIKDLKHWTDNEIKMVLYDDIKQCKFIMSQMIKGFDDFDDEPTADDLNELEKDVDFSDDDDKKNSDEDEDEDDVNTAQQTAPVGEPFVVQYILKHK